MQRIHIGFYPLDAEQWNKLDNILDFLREIIHNGKTTISRKQFTTYMIAAFGLAWILEIIAIIFSSNAASSISPRKVKNSESNALGKIIKNKTPPMMLSKAGTGPL